MTSCPDAVQVPCVDFLLQECKVLGCPLLNDRHRVLECVSMTSTNSASDLLNSFAPSGFHGLVDTVRDMFVDLAQPDLHFVELFLARDIF